MEIQRLIGRALRTVIDMKALGEKTLWIDCDVIQADGGTRTAAITGAFVAVVEALGAMRQRGVFTKLPVHDYLAATSVGIVDQQMLLDLRYKEDSAASVDMNVVMTGNGQLVEVQGTGETATFSRAELSSLLDFAEAGILQLIGIQRQVLAELGAEIERIK